LLFQLLHLPRQGRGGEIGDGLGQIKCSSEAKFEPEEQIMRAVLESECCVARQMRQTSVMPFALLLRGGIATRDLNNRCIPPIISSTTRAARETRADARTHPCSGKASDTSRLVDPNTGFVASDKALACAGVSIADIELL